MKRIVASSRLATVLGTLLIAASLLILGSQVTDELADYMDGSGSGAGELYDSEVYEVNNYGPNDNLLVRRDRDRDVPESELKTILMWNDAYGVRTYDIGHGREPFYRYV